MPTTTPTIPPATVPSHTHTHTQAVRLSAATYLGNLAAAVGLGHAQDPDLPLQVRHTSRGERVSLATNKTWKPWTAL